MRPRSRTFKNSVVLFCVVSLSGAAFGAGPAGVGVDEKRLQLEVIVNNTSINMIGSFVWSEARLSATPNELEDLGIRIESRGPPTDLVSLDSIPGLKYVYDEKKQRVLITVDASRQKARVFDLRQNGTLQAKSDWGTVLNYNLFGVSNNLQWLHAPAANAMSVTLEGRAFSPYGTLSQSAILRSSTTSAPDSIRLDTSFRHSDQSRMISYGAGDAITGGLAWSRPIRIGGLQAQSNFALRPDLVTMPIPSIGGTAVLPSTVDLYINNVKTFSQMVAAGPFSINNIPAVSGAGNARLVVRDSSGRETQSTLPFYSSPNLLAPELMSWSAEIGLPRLSYGAIGDTYVSSPAGVATLRRGIFDWLTIEGHAELGNSVTNGGVGASFAIGTIGVANTAVSMSAYGAERGGQGYVSYESNIFGLNISLSSQRSFGSYEDLASATARMQSFIKTDPAFSSSLFSGLPGSYLTYLSSYSGLPNSPLYTSWLPPRALDRITLSAPLSFDLKSNASASFIHSQSASGVVSDVVSVSYSRAMPLNSSFFSTVFYNFGTSRGVGAYAGLSIPLGDAVTASVSTASGNNGRTGSIDVVKSLGTQEGSYGWRLRDSEGAAVYRDASASYRSNYGVVQAQVGQNRAGQSGTLELRGSIVSMSGDLFLADRVEDGFAVVDAGASGLEVFSENRPVGKTDSKGKLMIPTLRSYQKNKINVDPTNLPVDAEIVTSREIVAPADRAGVSVNFQVKSHATSALVSFVNRDGIYLTAGAIGQLNDGKEFVVGYNGEAFIDNLRPTNIAKIQSLDGDCSSEFAFSPQPGQQVRILNVSCR